MSCVLQDCRCSVRSAGINTFQLGDLQIIYQKLCAEGRDRFLFADGTVQSFFDFESLVTHESTWFYAGYGKEGDPLAVALLDSFKGKTAHMHFAFFKAGTRQRHAIASRFLSLLFAGGLSALFGCTSTRFHNVRAFARELGFQEIMRIPAYFERLNRRTGSTEYHDTMLSVCTPQTLINLHQP